MDSTGRRLIEVLKEAYDHPFFLQGDFARSYSLEVASAASMGLISNVLMDGTPTRQWRVTEAGLSVLRGFYS